MHSNSTYYNNCIIPELIEALCLLYYRHYDSWDEIEQYMIVQGNLISISEEYHDGLHLYQTAFLKEICCNNFIYRWKFKIEKYNNGNWYWNNVIGVINVDDKENKELRFYQYHHEENLSKNSRLMGHFGYGFISSAAYLTNPKNHSQYGEQYGIMCKECDVIEMCLDLKNYHLSYIVNNVDYGKAFDVERNKRYKAAVTIDIKGNSLRLLQ